MAGSLGWLFGSGGYDKPDPRAQNHRILSPLGRAWNSSGFPEYLSKFSSQGGDTTKSLTTVTISVCPTQGFNQGWFEYQPDIRHRISGLIELGRKDDIWPV